MTIEDVGGDEEVCSDWVESGSTYSGKSGASGKLVKEAVRSGLGQEGAEMGQESG